MALGSGFANMFGYVTASRRQDARSELHRCFPDKSAAEIRGIVRRMYRHMGRNYAEMLRWAAGHESEMDLILPPSSTGSIDQALQQGRGALILTAHLGNWDLLALWAARRYPLTIISKNIRNPAVNDFWMAARKRSGLGILPPRNSFRPCMGVLKKNELLGFIIDQNMRRPEGVFVDFFGKPACTTPGLALLSAVTQAPVLPVFLIRQPDGKLQFELLPAIPPPAGRDEQTIRDMTQQYTNVVESVIRRYPDQWIWMHRRWKTTPAPAPAKQEAQA
jgi:KDO2-lipid IV(A) lauroyltransferase